MNRNPEQPARAATADARDIFEVNQQINDRVGGPHRYYVGDMNAAMSLLDTVSEHYTPRLVRMLAYPKHLWKCVIMPNIGDGEEFEALDESPALAICRAWLAYAAPRPGDGDPAGE